MMMRTSCGTNPDSCLIAWTTSMLKLPLDNRLSTVPGVPMREALPPNTSADSRKTPFYISWFKSTSKPSWHRLESVVSMDLAHPQYVEKAFYRYSECGVFSRGFARCRCRDWVEEFLVPFTVKLQTPFSLPSCSTRRMHDTALRLCDTLPLAPYRQWVLSPPWHRPGFCWLRSRSS